MANYTKGEDRPNSTPPAVLDELLELIASGQTTRAAAAAVGINRNTIHKLTAKDAAFAAAYKTARERCMESWADELIEVSDGATERDWKARQLRVDTRKWLMSRMLPAIYGDKLQTQHDVAVTVQIVRFCDLDDKPNTKLIDGQLNAPALSAVIEQPEGKQDMAE